MLFGKNWPKATGQNGPKCVAAVQKNSANKEHICPECNYRTHRDHVAAQVIRLRGLEKVTVDGGERKMSANSILSEVLRLDLSTMQKLLMASFISPRSNL
ncbi:MAG: transposase [Okeania sp. SIO3B5]|uniref:zinc ribbon domain-containing protein n=1 Tax=Okeania sp. SIO3B5 TaxID=2607811 RepID=UPI0014000CA8|nr:zinc ribbon domain-containing protein [Okeania sp. SIO3B5]NEO55036.1 transposase [Okeania sp. SIO3B5]